MTRFVVYISILLLSIPLTGLSEAPWNDLSELAFAQSGGEGVNAKYNKHMKQGETYLKDKLYDKALTEFEAALSAKSGDSYAKFKIEQTKRYQSRQEAIRKSQEKERKYIELVATANGLMGERNFELAIKTYEEALKLFPERDHLALKITSAMTGMERQKERDKIEKEKADAQLKYNELLSKADNHFNQKEYEKAIESYKEASKVKELEQYPMLQIQKSEELIVKRKQEEAEAARWQKYYECVAEADKMLINKQYEQCIKKYEEAATHVKNQYHPKIKTQVAQDMIIRRSRDSLEYAYKSEVVTADEYREKEEYEKAIEFYNKALEVNPLKQYPITKIEQCNDFIQRREAEKIRKEFEAISTEALELLRAENYVKAKEKYFEALEIYPLHTHTKTMIRECDKWIKKEEEKNRKPVNYFLMFNGGASKTSKEVEGGQTDITFDGGSEKNKSFKELYLDEDDKKKTFYKAIDDLAKNYPPGITEELKTGVRKNVVRRIKVIENLGYEYLKVEHEWGGVYYFKDGEAINKQLWEQETQAP